MGGIVEGRPSRASISLWSVDSLSYGPEPCPDRGEGDLILRQMVGVRYEKQPLHIIGVTIEWN